MKTAIMFRLALLVSLAMSSIAVRADDENKLESGCPGLPTHAQLVAALKSVVDVGGTNNSGFGLNMWATVVNRDGEVCGVAFRRQTRGDHRLVGALGISGDTSCTDHVVAWKVRKALGLDFVPAGVSPTGDDNMVHDPSSGWFHPVCSADEKAIVSALPTDYPISH